MLVWYFYIFILLNIGESVIMPPPPGTRMVNDSVYLDMNLIGIEDYEEFLISIKTNNDLFNINYQECLPDSSPIFDGIPYLNSKNYKRTYPVLNISDKQINIYCKWRSAVVNLMKNNSEKRCDPKHWAKFDIGDSLKITRIEYTLADSILINLSKPVKQINIPEKYRNEKSSVLKFVSKHFGHQKITGFRCKAMYKITR